jgi:hypothetical protein
MSNQARPAPTTPSGTQAGKPSMTGPGTQMPIPHDRIAKRAYEKWCKRGCPHGTHQQDWYEAEQEIRAEMMGQTTGRTAQPQQPMQQPMHHTAQPASSPQRAAPRR